MALQQLLQIVIFLLICRAAARSPEAEALLRWKSTLIRADSLSSWSLANSTCSWFGVTCDAAGHVAELNLPWAGLNGTLDALYSAAFRNLTRLDLSGNNIVGAIPANISLLFTLTVLDLSNNRLAGAIPYQLSELPNIVKLNLENNNLKNPEYDRCLPMPNLRFLSLYKNDLNGIFPQFITNCQRVRIRSLDLSDNAFTGPIPSSLAEIAPKLRYLDLSHNGFSGPIPRSLSRLQNLQTLALHSNNLTDGIPEELGMISGLQWLSLGKNLLGGSIPASLGKLQMLEMLDIREAGLVSTLPPELGNLTNLEDLSLSGNQLSGNLPPSCFANWTGLMALDLSTNLFGGSIPAQIGNLTSLQILYLSDNNFFGVMGEARSALLCELQQLYLLDLSHNQLSGEIPSCISNLQHLQLMDLSHNAFGGEVPTVANNYSSLVSLYLSNNYLIGSFATVLKRLKNLADLDLGSNKFSGRIPTWIYKRNPLLRTLRLRSNKLYGSIPWQLSKLSHLRYLDLADNNFKGSIPKSFANLLSMQLPFMLLEKNASHSGKFDIVWKGHNYIFQFDSMIGIDLSCNFLSGEIPSELTNLRGIRLLNLSRNYLSGNIPEDIGNLTLLESLDLSDNKLSGIIPWSVSYLFSLTSLNLSNNNLSGEIPKGNQLRTLDDPSIYSNNPGLCGFPLIPCTNHSSSTVALMEHHRDFETLWLYYSVIAGAVFGFWLWFGTLLLCRSVRFTFLSSIDTISFSDNGFHKRRAR